MALSATQANDELIVVLKMDDVRARNGDVPVQWQRLYQFAREEQVPVSIGVICDSLAGEHPVYFKKLREWSEDELIELWNHGYNHRRWTEDGVTISEFSKSGLVQQLKTIADCQRLGQEKLGLTFTTFGAPFNAVDRDTRSALQEFPELNVWLYGPGNSGDGATLLERDYRLNLEPKVGQVDFSVFKERFESHQPKSPLVLQGHPGMWDEQDFSDFKNVIFYLLENGAVFALPRDFAPKK